MIAHTEEFKNELFKFGRQYKNKIRFYDNLLLATESGDTLTTERNDRIIAKRSNEIIKNEIDDTHLFSIKIINKGEILSTLMKELDFTSDLDLEVGSTFNYKFGILVNDNYEYLDYGKFIIYSKEYQNDTKNYYYKCYDPMLKAMIKIGGEFTLSGTTTGGILLQTICDILSIDFDNSLLEQDNTTPTPYGMIKVLDYPINLKPILEANITYRDLLNSLCQYFGVSMYMDINELKIKLLGDIVEEDGVWKVDNENVTFVDTIDERPFKDKNVTFKEKYGRINALNVSGTDENKTIYIQNNQSVSEDGATLFEIKSNIILNDTSNWNTYSLDIANNIFNLIDGVNFNLCDYSSYGILYLEWLDYYTADIDGITYKGLLLNSEITIKSGIEENIYTEQPEKHVSEYTTSPKKDDIIGDTIRAKGNAYANGERLIQESELSKMFPINKVEVFFDNLDHSDFLGFIWERVGAGRVPVGIDINDSDFDTIGETGGEKIHTLTINEIPSHIHDKILGTGPNLYPNWGSSTGWGVSAQYLSGNGGMGTDYVGGGQAHNNLQPYIVMAFWKRTG